MGNLINNLGGYNSWQLIVFTLGLLIIGLLLRMKWIYLMPIPLVGVFLAYLQFNYAFLIAAPNIKDPIVLGLASIMPMSGAIVMLLIVIAPEAVNRIFGVTPKNKNSQ